MKNYLYKYILFFVLGTVLFSCKSKNSKQTIKTRSEQDAKKTTNIAFQPFSFKPFSDSIQIFTINPNKKQTIKGRRGTKVTFPADCFGKVKENVKIKLIECYSIPSMILNGLTTQTVDGKNLETDGMIYLNAFNSNGDTLKIQQGKKIKIQMPTDKVKKGMKVYSGKRINGKVKWKLADIPLENTKIAKKSKEKLKNNGRNVPLEIRDSASFSKKQYNVPTHIKNINLIKYTFRYGGQRKYSLGWINMDRLFKEYNAHIVAVRIDESYQEITAYLVLENYNAFFTPINFKAENGYFRFTPYCDSSYILLGLATRGDTIYFGMKEYNNNQDTISLPVLNKISRVDLVAKLKHTFGGSLVNRPSF